MMVTEESRDFMVAFFKENAPKIDAEKRSSLERLLLPASLKRS